MNNNTKTTQPVRSEVSKGVKSSLKLLSVMVEIWKNTGGGNGTGGLTLRA